MKLRIPAEPVVEVAEEANRALAGSEDTQPEREEAPSDASTTPSKRATTFTASPSNCSRRRTVQRDLQGQQGQASRANDIRVGMKLKLPAC